jgi:hypothetical protein
VEIRKGGKKMNIELIVALVVAIPIVLFPAAFVWYLNIGGVVARVREVRAAREKKAAKAGVTA